MPPALPVCCCVVALCLLLCTQRSLLALLASCFSALLAHPAASPSRSLACSAGLSETLAYCTSLRLDSNRRPVVAYVDMDESPSCGYKPTVQRWSGSAWSVVGQRCVGLVTVSSGLKLGLDSSDTPYLFHSDDEASPLLGAVYRYAVPVPVSVIIAR
jgi:hypothetical protein